MPSLPEANATVPVKGLGFWAMLVFRPWLWLAAGCGTWKLGDRFPAGGSRFCYTLPRSLCDFKSDGDSASGVWRHCGLGNRSRDAILAAGMPRPIFAAGYLRCGFCGRHYRVILAEVIGLGGIAL